jgi:hypothetical protein
VPAAGDAPHPGHAAASDPGTTAAPERRRDRDRDREKDKDKDRERRRAARAERRDRGEAARERGRPNTLSAMAAEAVRPPAWSLWGIPRLAAVAAALNVLLKPVLFPEDDFNAARWAVGLAVAAVGESFFGLAEMAPAVKTLLLFTLFAAAGATLLNSHESGPGALLFVGMLAAMLAVTAVSYLTRSDSD